MTLDNFRIVKLDKLNLTFEEYKEVIRVNRKEEDGRKVIRWVQVGGYYSSLEETLKALKKYIIFNFIEHTYDEVIQKIEKLNKAIVECNLVVRHAKSKQEVEDDDTGND